MYAEYKLRVAWHLSEMPPWTVDGDSVKCVLSGAIPSHHPAALRAQPVCISSQYDTRLINLMSCGCVVAVSRRFRICCVSVTDRNSCLAKNKRKRKKY